MKIQLSGSFVAGSLSSGVGGLESKLGDEILGEREDSRENKDIVRGDGEVL